MKLQGIPERTHCESGALMGAGEYERAKDWSRSKAVKGKLSMARGGKLVGKVVRDMERYR